LYEGHIYFELNMDARFHIHFDWHFPWLKYFAYHLVSVLAPNYKQNILSPAKVEKYVIQLNFMSIRVFEFIRMQGERS
jgi:hypothetical protein